MRRDRIDDQPSRRRFIVSALAATPLLAAQVSQPSGGAAMGPGDGELLRVGPTRDAVRIKVSPPGGGRFAMITQEMAPGSRIPVHLHEREDEIIFIQRGRGRATLGDTEVAIEAGSTLFVPQGTWHAGENTGQDVMLWVAIYSPSGFEGYFREIAIRAETSAPPRRTPEEREALDRRYGIRYPG